MISKDVESVDREVERLIRDLRHRRPGAGPVDAARRLAQVFADTEADLAGRPRREVPRLADRAVADQVAVTWRELRDALLAAEIADADTLRVAVADVRARLASG